ncbi:hypothetical protein Tco_0144839 [Tanacetum coccineum]
MPLREWTTKDKKRICNMLNKIDDLLFKRRVLRSLEVLVGGRKIETDKRMLQRTTKTKLILEQTQQGVSDEVLVGPDGTEGSCKDGDGETSF